MKISFNPANSNKNILDLIKNNKDIIFDLKGHSIFARGVEFKGTDTNTWRPVVDNLTSDSTTSSLSAKQGKVLKALIDGKSNSDHNHDGRYLRLSGQDTMQGNLYLHSHGTSYIGKGLGDKSGADFTEANIVIRSWWGISFKSYDDIVRTYIDTRTGNIGTKGVLNAAGAVIQGRVYNSGDDEGIIINPAFSGYAGLILGTHNGERSVFYFKKGNPFWRYNNGSTNLDIYHPKKSGTIALTSDIPNKDSWNYDDRYLRLTGGWMSGDINFGGDNKIYWGRNTDSASISFKNDGDGDANSYMSFVTSDNGNEYFRWSHSSSSTNTEWMALRSDGLRVRGTKVSLEGHSHNDLYYTKAESNAKYITDITTSVNKLTFTKNGSNIIRDITVNVVHSQGRLTNIPNKDATTKASPGLLIYDSYEQTIGTNSYSSVLSINTGGTIQIAGNWGDDHARNLYWRSQSNRNVADYPWKSWRTILDSENYSSTLDSRYYTESEVNSLLDAKLNRQNLSYGNWNPRGWNLAADYHYNGGDLSISESGGKIHVSVDGYFWQNEGQYRVLDTSDIGDIRDSVTLHQYLSATDAAWYPLVWGGASHNNTSDSTGPIYKSYDKLCWQTSSQTLYATNIQTNNIKNLSIGGGIYWNPNVESATEGSDAASITLVRSGVAGGTTLVLSQMNDTNDTIQFKTNTAARLYHNSYPILTTQNTYVSNNKGYINGLEITQVNNADTLDGAHLSDIKNWSDRTASAYWKAGWYKVASAQTATNIEAFLTLDVNAANSKGHATLFIRKRADSKPYFICTHNNNLNLADFRLYYNGMSMVLYARVPNDWNGRVFRIISEGREGIYDHIWTLYRNMSSTDPNAISAEGGNPYINPTYSGRVDWSNSSDKANYANSAGSVAWNNVTGKPSAFNPAAHTHTVFKNNLMIKGTNGISDSASIHLGIGDSDTGFKWISDGVCQIYANNAAVGQWTSGGMNWFKNPTVNGNKVWNAGNDGSGSGLDADTVDGYHAASFVKMYTGRFTQYNKGTWTKILQFTIPSGHLDPTISFIWHPTECARDVWADFNINIRSGSPIFYVNWKGTTRRTVYCVGDGTTYSVWVQGTKSGWDPFGLVQVISTGSINTYQAGSLQYSDSEPTGTYKVVASMSGIIMYADRLLTARKINGTSFDGTSDITTAYWGTTRTISLTGAITGSVSTNGGGNITINTTYGTGNITNLDNRYVKKAGDTMQGNLTFTSGKQTRWTARGTSYITDGNVDSGTSLGGNLANLVISSWYGVSFTTSCSGQTYTNKTAVGINCRTGIVYAANFVGPLQGNAATATKLQTSRSIWGQSFDGTRDVSGTLSGVANIQFSADGAYDIGSNSATSRYIYTHWLGAKSGSKLELGANNSGFGQGLCIDTNLNVGIGTNSPTQKLDVIGNIRATGQLYLPTNGNYNAILMGEDCWMGDCNISNVIGLSGTNNANSGGIKFGKGGMYIGYNGSNHYSSGTSLWTNFNADTVDGEHASSFVRAGHYESQDLNKLDTYSFIRSVNSNVSSTSPKGNTGWYNVIQLVHRNGAGDGPSYIGQIALGMTTNTNDMFFRGKRTDPWKTVIHSGNIGNQTVANAYHLRINSANSWSTWYWTGQSGQPSWLWGSNDGTNMYVWNPSNFNVNTAQYLRSLGNQNCQTGRTQAYGDVYSYNTHEGNTGSPTTYSSVIGFGRGIAGTVEIAGGWCNTHLYWRSLRDWQDDWFPWRTVLDSSNYTEFINNYYWANVKISASSSTTTSPTFSNVYLGNSLYLNNRGSNSIYNGPNDSANGVGGPLNNLVFSSQYGVSFTTSCSGQTYTNKTAVGINCRTGQLYARGVQANGFMHIGHNNNDAVLLAGGGYKTLKDFIFLNKSYNYTDGEHYNLAFRKLSGICNNLVWVDGFVRGEIIRKNFAIDPALLPYPYNEDPDLDTIYFMSWVSYITINAAGIVTINNAGQLKYRVGFFYTGRA